MSYIGYEGFPVITTLLGKMREKIVTTPFHFDPLPIQVPKSPYQLHGLESAIIFANFGGDLAPT